MSVPYYGVPMFMVPAPCQPSTFLPMVTDKNGRRMYAPDVCPAPQSFVRKVELGQHVIKYLKATKIVDKVMKAHKVHVAFNHAGSGDYEMLLTCDKSPEGIAAAEMDLIKRVQGFSILEVTMAHNYVAMLKIIKNAEIAQKLKEIGVQAGWHANDFTAEVFVCSDSPSSSEKAFTALYRLVLDRFGKMGKSAKKVTSGDYAVVDHVELMVAQVRYIHAGFCRKSYLEHEHHVKLECSVEEKVIKIFGNEKEDVSNAREDILRWVKKLAYTKMTLTPEVFTHLLLMPTRPVVQDLNQMCVVAGWQAENCELTVCSDCNNNLRKAVSAIMGRCFQQAGMFIAPTFLQPGHTTGRVFGVSWDVARVRLPMNEENLRYLKTMIDELQYMVGAAVFIDLEHSFLEVYCSHRNLAVEAKRIVEELVSKLVCISYERSQAFLTCFRLQKTGRIVAALRTRSVRAGWSIRNGKLWLCSDSEQSVSKAYAAAQDILVESSYKVDDLDLLRSEWFSDHFQQLTEELQKKTPSLVLKLDVNVSQVDVASTDREMTALAIEMLKDMLSHACYESRLEVGSAQDLVERNLTAIENMVSSSVQEVALSMEGSLLCVTSSNSQTNANFAKDQVEQLLANLYNQSVSAEYLASMNLNHTDVLSLVHRVALKHGTVGSVVKTSTNAQKLQMVDENGNLPSKETHEGGAMESIWVTFIGLTENAVNNSEEEFFVDMKRLLDKQHFIGLLAALDLEEMKRLAGNFSVSIIHADGEASLEGDVVSIEDFLTEFHRRKSLSAKSCDEEKCAENGIKDEEAEDNSYSRLINEKEFVFEKTVINTKTDGEQYKLVMDLFNDTCNLSSVKVLQVMKVKNDEVSSNYAEYFKANGEVEKYLWHGNTNSKNLFDLQFTGRLFGRNSGSVGVYFSISCEEALRYSSKLSPWEGYIALVKVVIGGSTVSVPRDSDEIVGHLVHDMKALLPQYLVKCAWRGQI